MRQGRGSRMTQDVYLEDFLPDAGTTAAPNLVPSDCRLRSSEDIEPILRRWPFAGISGSLSRHTVDSFLRGPSGRTLEIGWLEPLRRLPETLQFIVAASLFCKYVDHQIHVVKKHPLRLAVALDVSGIEALAFETKFHLIGDSLDLPRIDPAAHHEIVRK